MKQDPSGYVMFLGLAMLITAIAVIYFYFKVIEFFVRSVKLYVRMLSQLETQTQLLQRMVGDDISLFFPTTNERTPSVDASTVLRHTGPLEPHNAFNCPKCGEELQGQVDKCHKCGSRFEYAVACKQCERTVILEPSEVAELRFSCPNCGTLNPFVRKSLERRIAGSGE